MVQSKGAPYAGSVGHSGIPVTAFARRVTVLTTHQDK